MLDSSSRDATRNTTNKVPIGPLKDGFNYLRLQLQNAVNQKFSRRKQAHPIMY
jgi:hypothetical protein